jgi:hypothetical protein
VSSVTEIDAVESRHGLQIAQTTVTDLYLSKSPGQWFLNPLRSKIELLTRKAEVK